MIAGKSRFSRESAQKASDSEVCKELGAMSLQCLLLQRRLRLLGQIVRYGNKQLLNLLVTSRRDGAKLPWVRQVLSDMQSLIEHSKTKLADLGPPSQRSESWWSFIGAHPRAWNLLVSQVKYVSMPYDERAVVQTSDVCQGHFKCKLCHHPFVVRERESSCVSCS